MKLLRIASKLASSHLSNIDGSIIIPNTGTKYIYTNEHITGPGWLDAAEVAELENISVDEVVSLFPNGEWRLMKKA